MFLPSSITTILSYYPAYRVKLDQLLGNHVWQISDHVHCPLPSSSVLIRNTWDFLEFKEISSAVSFKIMHKFNKL